MKKIFPVILIILSAIYLPAQNVTITGKAPTHEGDEISVVIYDDYLSFTEKELTKSKIDSNGKFELKFSIPHTTDAMIRIDATDKTLYLEPGSKYEIIYPYGEKGTPPSPSKKSTMIEIVNTNDNELNTLIREFNLVYNEFTIRNYQLLIKGKGRSEVDALIAKTNSKPAGKENNYFNVYKRYVYAGIEQLTLKNKRNLLEEKYITSQPVTSDHQEYMRFIVQYFPNHLLMKTFAVEGEQVMADINKHKNYKALMDVLGRDPVLKNDTLRELILLKGLYEVYFNPDFKQPSILDLYDSIAVKTRIPQHKKIAKNIKALLLKLSPGSQAPGFELLDKDQKLVKLSDYQGKFVYIDFWATWCGPCIKEMRVMPRLHEKY